ncbi:MAG: ArsR/SmtB family transcription factor [Thalassobaculum sp.]
METASVVAALSALAQDKRLAIFKLLVRTGPEGLSAGVIARDVGVAASTLSHHLALLEQARLVRSKSAWPQRFLSQRCRRHPDTPFVPGRGLLRRTAGTVRRTPQSGARQRGAVIFAPTVPPL